MVCKHSTRIDWESLGLSGAEPHNQQLEQRGREDGAVFALCLLDLLQGTSRGFSLPVPRELQFLWCSAVCVSVPAGTGEVLPSDCVHGAATPQELTWAPAELKA